MARVVHRDLDAYSRTLVNGAVVGHFDMCISNAQDRGGAHRDCQVISGRELPALVPVPVFRRTDPAKGIYLTRSFTTSSSSSSSEW